MAVGRFDKPVGRGAKNLYTPMNLPLQQMGQTVAMKDQMQRKGIQSVQDEAEEVKDLFGDLEGKETITMPDGEEVGVYGQSEMTRIKQGYKNKIDQLSSKLVNTDLTDGAGEIGQEWKALQEQVQKETSPGGRLYLLDQQRQNLEVMEDDLMENIGEYREDPSVANNYYQTTANSISGTNRVFSDSPLNTYRERSLDKMVSDEYRKSQVSPNIETTYVGTPEAIDMVDVAMEQVGKLKSQKYKGGWGESVFGMIERDVSKGVSEKRVKNAFNELWQTSPELQNAAKERIEREIRTGEITQDQVASRLDDIKRDVRESVVSNLSHMSGYTESKNMSDYGIGRKKMRDRIQQTVKTRTLADGEPLIDISDEEIKEMDDGTFTGSATATMARSLSQKGKVGERYLYYASGIDPNENVAIQSNWVRPLVGFKVQDGNGNIVKTQKAGEPLDKDAFDVRAGNMEYMHHVQYKGEPRDVNGVKLEKGDVLPPSIVDDADAMREVGRDNIDVRDVLKVSTDMESRTEGEGLAAEKRGSIPGYVDVTNEGRKNELKTKDDNINDIITVNDKQWQEKMQYIFGGETEEASTTGSSPSKGASDWNKIGD